MRNFYFNIYYRFYDFIRSIGEDGIPRYNAVLLMSIFSILNVMTFIGFLGIVFQRIIIVDWPKVYLFLLGLAVIGVNCYFIFGGKRYLVIEQRYANEGRASKMRNKLYVVLYILVTIGLLIVELVYMKGHPIIKRS